jgi:hypothetical protein
MVSRLAIQQHSLRNYPLFEVLNRNLQARGLKPLDCTSKARTFTLHTPPLYLGTMNFHPLHENPNGLDFSNSNI